MDGLGLLSQAQVAGLTVSAEGDKLVIRGPRSAEALAKELLEHKAEILQLLTLAWPPPDAEELITAWEKLDRPEIPLAPGITVSNLRAWFYPIVSGEHLEDHMAAVRGFLLEGLPACDVPAEDPLLDAWARVALPEWRGKLQDALAAGNQRGIEYARVM